MPKSEKRSEAMKRRMADPALRAKALANLEAGRAARAAKRSQGGPPPGKQTGATSTTQTEAPAPATRRAFGTGRWRAT